MGESRQNKRKDWAGKRYNKLTLLHPYEERKTSSGGILWVASCECGETTIISPCDAASGRIKACGCLVGHNSADSARKHHPSISTARVVWRRSYADSGLTFESFLELSQKNCFYCGIKPTRTYNMASKKANVKKGHKPSQYQVQEGNFTFNGLDRVDSSKGHSFDNVVPCCHTCNYMKLDLTLEAFLLHIEKVYEATKTLRENLRVLPAIAE